MYKKSSDLRFKKSKQALQRAFIDLTLEKRTSSISVKELTARAAVNRMTFYSHYDEVADILLEFLDDLTDEIIGTSQGEVQEGVDMEGILLKATELMQDEMEFYRLVAQDGRFELYRARFREAFFVIFSNELERSTSLSGVELELTAGMLASGVTYAYLDWLAGRYGALPLEELVALCERFIANQIKATDPTRADLLSQRS